MGDRELLGMAAKAAGYELHFATASGSAPEPWIRTPTKDVYWNPLTDDGDALRLAVRLKMEIDISNTGIAVRVPSGLKVIVDLRENSDPAAVTRMAIVRAAAEIGKAMAPSTDGGGV